MTSGSIVPGGGRHGRTSAANRNARSVCSYWISSATFARTAGICEVPSASTTSLPGAEKDLGLDPQAGEDLPVGPDHLEEAVLLARIAEVEDPLVGDEHALEDQQLVGFLAEHADRVIERVGAGRGDALRGRSSVSPSVPTGIAAWISASGG